MLLQIDVSFLTIPLELDSLKRIFDQHLINIYQRIYNVNTQVGFWETENENKCMINGREIELLYYVDSPFCFETLIY